MSNIIPLPFIEVDPISGLPLKTSLEPGGHILYEGSDGETYRVETDSFYPLLKNVKLISPSDTGPFETDVLYKPSIYSVDPGTNYPNFGNLKAIEGYDTLFFYNGTSWVKMSNKLPSSTDSVKVAFNSVIKFDQKRKYSVINQAGNINITYDPSGLAKDSMIKHLIISDGTGDLNFSSDFEVIGLSEIDKNKNQEIFYSRPEVVEFKVPAIIMNVAKSGQTSPIDLEPDALDYVNRIIAAGGTVSNGNQLAINNFYLSAKSNGYFSKLKGLWLAIGSNTNSRLVNGITGAPAGVLVSGTVTNDGIVGVIDSGLKPSNVFTLDSFSYGIHNTTPIYANTSSIGCATWPSSGITFSPTVLSGQLFFSGPNRDIYANFANADSLGAYVVSRTGASLAKCFKNGTLIFTHSANQGAATLPNINMALGGYNDNGTFSDDDRVSKWAFLAAGLTDTEASSITSDLQTLMTAIGR